MTWNAFHHRGEILQTVIDTANARQDGILPMDVDGVTQTFHGELDLVAALHLKWHARLSGNIERALMAQPMELEDAIASAWARTSSEIPGVRKIIDHYTASPSDPEMAEAMAKAQHKEWLKLAGAAGLASDESASAARAGEQVVLKARANGLGSPNADVVASPSLVERIKAVLAA